MARSTLDGRAAAGRLRGGGGGARRRSARHCASGCRSIWCPAAFVTLEALPLTPTGKVDRKALPAPERAASGSEEDWLAPRTPVEEVLAGIWAELLGLDRVGADGHFFELGGHSLLATRVMSRLRNAFGVELPLRDLFEVPTAGGVSPPGSRPPRMLRSGARQAQPPLVPVPRAGPCPCPSPRSASGSSTSSSRATRSTTSRARSSSQAPSMSRPSRRRSRRWCHAP